jgi:hypothetical protein
VKEQYRGFNLYTGAVPVLETLLGRISQWSPTGSIDYVRRVGSLVELTRFRLASMTFNDKKIAEWFGLEIARLAVDSCYRDFVIARYQSEKQLVKRDRLRK